MSLLNSAKDNADFDILEMYSPDILDSDFKLQNVAILSQSKGAGYWLWKPYIILNKLLKMNDGDILCYCDSMYLFKSSIKKLNIDFGENDIFITHNKPNEPKYIEKLLTKRDAFILMNTDKPEFHNTPQVWAGFAIIKKSEKSIKFYTELLEYSKDARIITDIPSTLDSEYAEFRENRHDQTVLSLLAKRYNITFHDFPMNLLHNLRVPFPSSIY